MDQRKILVLISSLGYQDIFEQAIKTGMSVVIWPLTLKSCFASKQKRLVFTMDSLPCLI